MVYTFLRRRKLNNAFRAMFPDMEVEENKDGVPMLFTNQLPEKAFIVENVSEIESKIEPCTFAWKSVIPVLVKTGMTDKLAERFLVNYVNMSNDSLMRAKEYIAQERLYLIEGCMINVP